MNNLTLFVLGLVLVNIPSCLSQQCFSQLLTPPYPCCKGNKIVYTDDSGNWGVENNKWCGINNDPIKECFSRALGYPCCKSCEVLFTDADGDWGVEDNEWCGILDSCSIDTEVEDPEVQDPEVEDPDEGISDFDFSFLKMENNKENMLYSPLSIKYALQMLKEGATNNTLAEINNVIGNGKLTKYQSIDQVLSLANGIFIRDTFYDYVKANYINTLKEKYGAEVKKDEFKDAKNANQWIEDKTLGIIKDMLVDRAVNNPNNLMLLINALAIDMEWVTPFLDKDTTGRVFILDNGERMEATTMSSQEIKRDVLSYYIDDNVKAITLDLKKYDGIQFEFMGIMPNENLSSFIENISKEQIEQIDKNLTSASSLEYGVKLFIPKFQFDYDLKLKDDLMKLGIKDAFDADKANFTKITDSGSGDLNLFVTDALHKANIEFTEKGVKAAAVTVLLMGNGFSMPRPTRPLNIEFDKPFMFIIRDKTTKDVWFTGTVYKPNSWEDDKNEYERSPYSGWSY
ncbi:Non-catalytic module family DOC2 [Piromyces sp. E2]|nr:Non-catalytic module family DOC2 [Piromyces sp. E2]|eukprot:OUM59770.1 Non-catalytic module family DOC2 [Piromyces sp. E2]